LVSGIIGAGAATAVILAIILLLPQLTPQQQSQQHSQTQTEVSRQQQEKAPLQPTPQQSPSANEDSNNNPTTAQSTTTASTADPWEQLRLQDAVFDDFYNTINECTSPPLNAEEQAIKPSTITCRQTIQNGTANWCNTGENYHAEKCEAVNFLSRIYDFIS
jgi:cytoskeletal protein RodZ